MTIQRRASARRFLFAAFASLFACLQAAAADGLQKESLEFSGRSRSFHLFAPDALLSSTAAPLVVVLHGSYSNGRLAAAPWIDLARSERFIVAAPDARDRSAWRIKADGPAFIRAVVDAVDGLHAIDRRRIYLFGHSGGAVYALTLAMVESSYYAAAAVHGGAWRTDQEFNAIRYADRKIPVAIFIGDRDRFFPLFTARRTERALQDAGHPVELIVMPDHGHEYRKVAPRVTRQAWEFFEVHAAE